MFSALILVCAAGVKDVDSCYYLAHEKLFESYQACEIAIKETVIEAAPNIEIVDELNGFTWKITDYRCVNWKGVRI